MNSYLKIAIVIVAFIVGFFLGRKTIDVEEKVTFVKGEAIHDTIVINEPTFVEIPSKPKYRDGGKSNKIKILNYILIDDHS